MDASPSGIWQKFEHVPFVSEGTVKSSGPKSKIYIGSTQLDNRLPMYFGGGANSRNES